VTNTAALPDVLDDARARELFQRAPCLFLDCDGVIFDSNGFKLEAMRQTLEGHEPGEIARMEAFWRTNGGVSRFVKFRHFYSEIAPRDGAEEAMAAASRRFGQLSLAAYGPVPPVPDALDFARAAGAARCHVVSGAAQVELEAVFADKQIAPLFASVLGSPTPKQELVSNVLERQKCPPSEALLVGDGAMDFRVCQALGVHFIYLAEYSEWVGAAEAIAGAPRVSAAKSWADLRRALRF
jgi:phosphoglycolate phosphatase-like HAD superfamily hydrolase